jgi:hypothetical protein
MANSKRTKTAFLPEAVPVWLGKGDAVKQYNVSPATWATLFQLKDLFREFLDEVSELWNGEIFSAVQAIAAAPNSDQANEELKRLAVNPKIWGLLEGLLNKPQALFVLAIPEINESLFYKDNLNGITIPQVWATLEVIMEVNQLEAPKALLLGGSNPSRVQ